MDGSSKQPSSADITAMDGSSNNKTNSSNSNSNSSNKNHRTNNHDSESSSVSSSSLASTTIGDTGYCTAGPSTPMATMTTCNGGTRSTSSFALPTPIPPSSPGCGCIVMGPPALDPEEITIRITPTTGGQFDLTVERNDTIENLKKIISKRLKVAKERICLLHRERQLREGTLKENRLQDGSRLTLLPSVETGLMGQRPEQSVMQALESLNDSQVNDFLSGKAPLNLTMRLGDQMMLIQLQLSTVTPASPPASSVGPSGVTTSSPSSSTSSSSSSTSSSSSSTYSSSSASSSPCENSTSLIGNNNTFVTSQTTTSTNSGLDSVSMPVHRRSSDHLVRSMRIAKQNENSSSNTITTTTAATTTNTTSNSNTPAGTSSLISSFASALRAAASCSTSISTATTTTNPCASERTLPTSQAALLPSSTPFWQRRQLLHHRHHHSHHHHHHHHHHPRNRLIPPWQSSVQTSTTSTPTNSLTEQTIASPATTTNRDDIVGGSSTTPCTPPKKKLCTMGHHHSQTTASSTTIDNVTLRSPECDSNSQSPTNSIMGLSTSSKVAAATLDTRALAEASRNLTQKLKQLSSEVLTSRVDLAEEHARRRQGAIIESMHHHGKGVYSGTFSGTLNPALQDRHGRPKRDISTIIHILNDLLCATPAATASHYRHHHRHNSGRQQSSSTSSNSGTSSATLSPNGSFQDSTPGYSMEELSRENEATKGKMRRLRLVMEQRRAKRKARRQARAAPYTTQWAALTPDPSANHDPNTTSASSSASGTNSAEPQNEPELQPCSPEPVVA